MAESRFDFLIPGRDRRLIFLHYATNVGDKSTQDAKIRRLISAAANRQTGQPNTSSKVGVNLVDHD
jgi:hypothetical protein